jgi:hypothetical protein
MFINEMTKLTFKMIMEIRHPAVGTCADWLKSLFSIYFWATMTGFEIWGFHDSEDSYRGFLGSDVV